MRVAPLVAIALLAPAAFLVAPADTVQAQSSGPAWWDTDWPFRVIVEPAQAPDVPEVGGQTSNLQNYELDFETALDEAGWPASLGTAPDPDSIVVVPYASQQSVASPMDPVPAKISSPVSRTGSCDDTQTSRCLVTFEEVDGATAYGIYWGPADSSLSPPVDEQGPGILGTTQGHEHYAVLNDYETPEILVSPAPSPSDVQITSRTPAGTETVDTEDCSEANDVLACTVPEGRVRVLTSNPTTVTVHEDSTTNPKNRLLPLVGKEGQTGEDLLAAIPEEWDPDATRELVVWADEGACTSSCNIDVSPSSAGSLTLTSSAPQSVEIPDPQAAQSVGVTVTSGDGPVHAAMRGEGFAPIESRDAAGTDTWVPVSSNPALTVETPNATNADINDVGNQEKIQTDRELSPPLTTIGLPSDSETIEVLSDDPVTLYGGSKDDTAVPLHAPIGPRDRVPVPASAELIAVSPALGGATQTIQVESIEGAEPASDILRLSATASRQVVGAGSQAALIDVDTDAPVGFLVRTKSDNRPVVGQALAVHHPSSASLSSAGYVANAIDISVTPSSTFAGSGSVASFNVTVRNLAQTASGDTPSLEVDLGLDPLGTAEGNLSTTISQSSVRLPGESGASRSVELSTRVAEGLSDVVLPLRVNGTVRDSDDLTASAKTRISVVTIRDFQLSFQDGSTEQTATIQEGRDVTFDLQVQNTGTVPIDVQLNRDTFGGEGFDVCLATSNNECSDEIVAEQIEPGRSRDVELVVSPPESSGDEKQRLEISVRGQLAERSGPVRTVDATVFSGLPVGATIQLSDDSVALAPGDTRTLDVVVENTGIQTDATLTAPESGRNVNTTLVDPSTGEASRTLVRDNPPLGPSGTTAATWENELEIAIDENAQPGLKTEQRLELTLEPGGGIPQQTISTAIPVRIIRVLNDDPLNAASIPAGVSSDVRVPVQTPSLADSTVGVRLLDAPARWDVVPPSNLTFDENGQTVLSFSATPPPGEKPGNATVVFSVLDPLGPGGELPVNLDVARGGQVQISTDERAELAIGDATTLPIDLQNVGNAPLSGSVELDGTDNVTLTTPPVPTLEPGNGTIELPGTITATGAFEGTVDLTVLDGNTPAGNTTIDVLAARAEISLAENRIVPSENPSEGEPYPVTVSVNNAGPVGVRNLTVALLERDAIVAQQSIQRLPASGNATDTIEWIPDHDAERSDLSIRVDPEGRLVQDASDDSASLGEANETPSAGVLITILSLAVPSSLRGFWGLMSRRERWLAVGGIVLLFLLIPALFIPTIGVESVDTTPSTPEDVVDTDDDDVSDTAEITRYGTNPRASDSDSDAIPDGWEAQRARFNETFRVFRPDPGRADAGEDPDDDGLINLGEFRNGTDPHDPDSDDDGFPDGWEIRSGLNPLSPTEAEADCDDDGLNNQREFELGTLACERDSDDDGIPDPAELEGTWEFDGESYDFEHTDPTKASTGGSGSPDGWLLFHELDPLSPDHRTEDTDGDRISTTREWRYTDRQGLDDPDDWTDGLDPTTSDTDGDGLPDGWELRNGLDPIDPEDGNIDSDEDGLSNGQEFQAGTNPNAADTDGDGLSDGEEVNGYTITVTKGSGEPEEVAVQSNPLIRDTDGDGLGDAAERQGQVDGREFPPTNPLSGDTDGDGLGDQREVLALDAPEILDPTNADTDDDGLQDGREFELWNNLADRAETDANFASRIRQQVAGSVDNAPELVLPGGDLDGDGDPNILDANADDPADRDLPRADEDTLTDGEEVSPPIRNGRQLPSSSPALRDTDGDGLPDGWEIRYTQYSSDLGGWLLDPNRADSDGDGTPDAEEDMETDCYRGQDEGDGPEWLDFAYTNEQELERETDPLECDTDGDGLPDGWEVAVINRASSNGVPIDLSVNKEDDPAQVSPVDPPGGDAKLFVDDSSCPTGTQRSGKTVCLYRWGDGVPQTTVETRRTNATFVQENGPCPGLTRTLPCKVVQADLARHLGTLREVHHEDLPPVEAPAADVRDLDRLVRGGRERPSLALRGQPLVRAHVLIDPRSRI